MTLTIELSPELEMRLKSEAAKSGMEQSEYAKQLLERELTAAPPIRDQATLDLLARWNEEDQTSDPDELSRRNRDYGVNCCARINRTRSFVSMHF